MLKITPFPPPPAALSRQSDIQSEQRNRCKIWRMKREGSGCFKGLQNESVSRTFDFSKLANVHFSSKSQLTDADVCFCGRQEVHPGTLQGFSCSISGAAKFRCVAPWSKWISRAINPRVGWVSQGHTRLRPLLALKEAQKRRLRRCLLIPSGSPNKCRTY